MDHYGDTAGYQIVCRSELFQVIFGSSVLQRLQSSFFHQLIDGFHWFGWEVSLLLRWENRQMLDPDWLLKSAGPGSDQRSLTNKMNE